MREFKKVLLITNIPNNYRIPLFNELNQQLKKLKIRLKVVFGDLGYSRRKSVIDMTEVEFEYDVLFTPKIKFFNTEKIFFTYKGLWRLIRKEKPDLTVTPGFSLATVKLWLMSLLFSTPYIIWTGSIKRFESSGSLIRKIQRRLVIKRAAGFIAYGTRSREYLESLGADKSKIAIAINTVDTKFYSEKVKELKNNLVRKDNKKHLLSIGYLSPRKNILLLLKIVNQLSKMRNDFVLDIVGDGDDREQLEKFVVDNTLNRFVRFHGFKQKQEIPKYMATAECFLFQTSFDIWGLVLNEAMAAGIPCIASIHSGASHDLINDGINGFLVDFADSEKVIERIILILDNPELSIKIGQNASRFMAKFASIKTSAQGIIDSLLLSIKSLNYKNVMPM